VATRDVVLRGGPAHGLVVSVDVECLHRPLTSPGWPNGYQWFLPEDIDIVGRPVFRCEVPVLEEYNFIVSPPAIAMADFDMITFIESTVRRKLGHPYAMVHVRWEGFESDAEIHDIDPRTGKLARYTMLKCGGVVIRDRHAIEEAATD